MEVAESHNILSNRQTIFGMPEGHDARYLAEKARELMYDDKTLIHICLDDTRLSILQELLNFFAPDVKYIVFPAWDCLPYDRVSPHKEVVSQRVYALNQLIDWEDNKERFPKIILATVNSFMQRVMPKSFLKQGLLSAKTGDQLELNTLLKFLEVNGYTRAETVREHGEFAIRGGLVDLFPPGSDLPIRIDLFGTEIESIKTFDPVSQRTKKKLSSFKLFPATEYFLDQESVRRFRAAYRELFGVVKNDDPLYEAISAGRRFNGAEHWLPLFYEHMELLIDYVPSFDIILDHLAVQAIKERTDQIFDFYQARKSFENISEKNKSKNSKSNYGNIYHPIPVSDFFVVEDEIERHISSAYQLSPFTGAGGVDGGGKKGRDFSDIRALQDGDVFGALKSRIQGFRNKEIKTVVATYSKGSRERLRSLFDQAKIKNIVTCDSWEDLKHINAQQTALIILPLEHGFESEDIALFTEQDILGDRLTRRRKKVKAENFLKEVSSLSPGDLVVHLDHGIGRFESLETVKAAGTLHDCLKIVYAGQDRLFVPVENLEVLSRFGSDEGLVQLDKLGGAAWQARKSKVKKDLMAIADHLLKIAANRALKKTERLELSNDLLQEFAASFPYQETEDQIQSILSVYDDLKKDTPMDRLVCGDVGFGKTEIALRAAYVAAMSGLQVAVVVPTTLLARQHYQNFISRFRPLGIKVEQLSRLVSSSDTKLVKEGLRDGSVNIVIGTHALFSKNIKFSHLGLLVVDEEQRFGVKQKEKLKEMKENVHVLTLSATPIPRTLQLALTGVRDLSIIATPPVDRLAIRTFVLPYDPVVVREALLREHYRGGQSFYVCPRISDIDEIRDQLEELVPEVKVISAHGQLPPNDLEDRMTAFYEGKYDVLLTTNIIESGIDIPTANTMIIHRADMFGLAQLYQIRGRIGRSKIRAYAYLTYEPNKKLTDQAQKRLEVIETLDTLGSGFQLASHDMDIRGAGNLLGEEQSGHIKEVGVELYQQMLEEAVAAAREGLDWTDSDTEDEKWSPQINVGTSVLIPEHYIEDLNIRMSLYRRLSLLENDEDIEGFAAELIDRFGDLPDEVENLLDIVKIKSLCRIAGVDNVEVGPKGAVISFYKNKPPNVDLLIQWIAQQGGAIKLRHDQKLVAIRQWHNASQRVTGIKSLMKDLGELSK